MNCNPENQYGTLEHIQTGDFFQTPVVSLVFFFVCQTRFTLGAFHG